MFDEFSNPGSSGYHATQDEDDWEDENENEDEEAEDGRQSDLNADAQPRRVDFRRVIEFICQACDYEMKRPQDPM